MTRTQAENILEAYVNMEKREGHSAAKESLREVILDAMTTTISYPYITTSPSIIPCNNEPWHITCDSLNTRVDQ